MNKIKLLAILTALVVGIPTIANALQTNSVENQRAINQDTAIQVRQAGGTPAAAQVVDSVSTLMDRYMTNFRTCEPVHLSQSIDLFGLKMGYQFDINGWVNNKCSYYMTGNISGLGNDIRDVFQVKATDEMIAKIKPVITCDFNQEQLDILVDGFVAAQERKISEKLTGTSSVTSDTSKKKMSPEEEKMMEMLMTSQACVIQNQEELMKNFSELMGTMAPPKTETSTPTNPTPEVSTPQAPELPTLEQQNPFEEFEMEKPILRESDGPKVNMPQAPKF